MRSCGRVWICVYVHVLTCVLVRTCRRVLMCIHADAHPHPLQHARGTNGIGAQPCCRGLCLSRRYLLRHMLGASKHRATCVYIIMAETVMVQALCHVCVYSYGRNSYGPSVVPRVCTRARNSCGDVCYLAYSLRMLVGGLCNNGGWGSTISTDKIKTPL